MRTFLALVLVCLASTAHASESSIRTLMRSVGQYLVAPDTTLALKKTPEGEIRYTIKKVADLGDEGVRTLTASSTFDAEGKDEFLFGWDGATNTLWMASPGIMMIHRFGEIEKVKSALPALVVSEAEFAKSPKQFQDEVRRRFPDNSVFLTIEPSNSR